MEDNMELEKELEETAEKASAESDDTAAEDKAACETPKKSGKGRKFLFDLLDIAESTISTVFVMVLVFTYLLHPVNVMGPSMQPTLYDKDRLLMTTVYHKLKYGDIVIIDNNAVYFLDENNEPYKASEDFNHLNECIIKRVIACEGQTVNINNSDPDRTKWTVEVDGKVLDEPYLSSSTYTEKKGAFDGKYPLTVPKGYYFVMGDNRLNSSDSRSAYVGLIKKDQIYGKALVRYSPLGKFKILVNSYKESAEE